MSYLETFRQIHTFIFDVDGVLTNNELLVTEEGLLLRSMNVRDGYAIKQAIRCGFRVAIVTGGKSEGVRLRLEALGVQDIYMGQEEKEKAFEAIMELYDLDAQGVLYMGDDLPDYPVMRRVGLPACPIDAAPELFQIAAYVSPFKGGAGCVRDVIEQVMRVQGKWTIDKGQEDQNRIN